MGDRVDLSAESVAEAKPRPVGWVFEIVGDLLPNLIFEPDAPTSWNSPAVC
jgi:hypothetical protein